MDDLEEFPTQPQDGAGHQEDPVIRKLELSVPPTDLREDLMSFWTGWWYTPIPLPLSRSFWTLTCVPLYLAAHLYPL